MAWFHHEPHSTHSHHSRESEADEFQKWDSFISLSFFFWCDDHHRHHHHHHSFEDEQQTAKQEQQLNSLKPTKLTSILNENLFSTLVCPCRVHFVEKVENLFLLRIKITLYLPPPPLSFHHFTMFPLCPPTNQVFN